MRCGRDIDETVQFQTARRGDPPLYSPVTRSTFLTSAVADANGVIKKVWELADIGFNRIAKADRDRRFL